MAAGGLRALFWPDGRVCWQVNLYLNSLRRQGLAVSTVNTYCVELSHYVKFLSESYGTIEGSTDDTLQEFSAWLGQSGRRPNTVRHRNRVVLTVLKFLEWLQQLLPLPAPLVGQASDGAQITITTSQAVTRSVQLRRVHHPALGPANVRSVVRPISTSTIEKLLSASAQVAKSRFAQSRNMALLKVLADCGVRRQEAAWVTVSAIQEAAVTGRLQVRTAKRRGNPMREVPIPKVSAQALLRYVNVDRALHMVKLERTRRSFKDLGWAFCTLQGTRMADASITQLMVKLRRRAGVSERATAHMFRHRWITLQVVERLRALNAHGRVGVELLTTLLSRIASLTGHASVGSLWTYVDWACEEVGIWSSVDAAASLGTDIRALKRDLHAAINGVKRRGDSEMTDLLTSLDLLLSSMLVPAAASTPSRSLLGHSRPKEWRP
jgi:site-specific recombinase XerD